MSQLIDYMSFLNINQHEGLFPNYLQLIVPGGVTIDEGIITRCTDNNVMISTAIVEKHPSDPNLVRVSPFFYQNHWDLEYHPEQTKNLIKLGLSSLNFFGLGKSFHGGSEYVNIQDILQQAADIFEENYLQGGSEEGCPED